MHHNPLLAGIRVLDLSRLLPGPLCTQYLAQMGAEVIKIEEPKGGDYARSVSPELFAMVNRAKKSITLDLRQEQDRQAFHDLVRTADVVIEGFRPGVMDRLRCGYETLKAINPRLVYVALTGYGQTGPYANRPGHDVNYRAYAGELMLQASSRDIPNARPFPVADLAGGSLNGVIGALAAIIGARASGHGTMVDVSMLDGLLALQVMELARIQERDSGHAREADGDALFAPMPNYAVYRCADGRFVALGSMERKFFKRFCELAGRPDLLDRPLWDSIDGAQLKGELQSLFLSAPRDHWEQLMAQEDTCVSALLSLEEAMEDPHVLARGMIVKDGPDRAFALPIKFSNAIGTDAPHPALGADNVRILGKS